MRLAFLVNDLASEHPLYTTTLLALEAAERGHEVWYVDVEGFQYRRQDGLEIRARPAPAETEDNEEFVDTLADAEDDDRWIPIRELDVLMLRNDPSADADERPWAQTTGIIFGQMAVDHGVIVLNDPAGLSGAMNKLYFQFFPESVRPRSVISRDPHSIRRFVDEHGQAVIKPLQGSGGRGVFLVREDEAANLNQIIEAVLRDGYAIAEEFLPEASEGDVRLFLMNGEPLRHEGEYAVLRRVGADGDVRSNMHAGGRAEAVEVDERALEIAAIVRPKLLQDGMFLVGLDIAGDKLLELNVFSPGALNSAERLAEVRFREAVVDALERKVAIAESYRGDFDNRRLATL